MTMPGIGPERQRAPTRLAGGFVVGDTLNPARGIGATPPLGDG
jgi:hypothetical protein